MPEKLLTLTCMYVREPRCTFTKSDLGAYKSPTKLRLGCISFLLEDQQQGRQGGQFTQRDHTSAVYHRPQTVIFLTSHYLELFPSQHFENRTEGKEPGLEPGSPGVHRKAWISL